MSGIIVAGGSGFIGQEVIRAARGNGDPSVRGGHRVVNIDTVAPRPPDPRLTGYRDINDDPEVMFIQADLSDPAAVSKAFDQAATFAGELHAVCNLAGLVKFGHPDAELRVPNVTVVERLVQECVDRGLLFIQFSGTAVHGNTLRGKVKETDPVKPIESYGRSKAMAESIITDRVIREGMRAIIFRATNPIGANFQRGELNKLYESVRKDLLVPGTRGSVANYVSTEDVGRALVFAIENLDTVLPEKPQAPTDIVFNLGVRESSSDKAVALHLVESIHVNRKKIVVEVPSAVVVGFASVATGATWLSNRVLRRDRSPILHYQLAKLFKGSHDHDQTKFINTFEANGFVFRHPTTGDVLDVGTVFKFLTDWSDKPRPARISALMDQFLKDRGSGVPA